VNDNEIHRGFVDGSPQATHHVQGWIDGVVHLGRWNFEDAEGVVQEILIKLLRTVRADRWKRQSSFKTFVFAVSKHTCIDIYRSERLRSHLSHEAEPGLSPSVPADQDVPLEDRQRLESIRFVLQQLPSECLRLWNWVYREGLAAGEVSRRMGISPGNVRVRVHRCLQKARSFAQDYEAAR